MVSVEFVDNLKNLNIFAFRICVNFRRTLRPLFCSDLLDFLYADYFKVNQLKLQTKWNLKVAENHEIIDFLVILTIFKQFGRGLTCAKF